MYICGVETEKPHGCRLLLPSIMSAKRASQGRLAAETRREAAKDGCDGDTSAAKLGCGYNKKEHRNH